MSARATSSSRSRWRAWPPRSTSPATPPPSAEAGGRRTTGVVMTIGIARVTLFLPAAHSLKEKRMVLRRVKTLVREKFNAAIAEVGENDLWQRAALGITVVGNDRAFTESALDEVVRFVQA